MSLMRAFFCFFLFKGRVPGGKAYFCFTYLRWRLEYVYCCMNLFMRGTQEKVLEKKGRCLTLHGSKDERFFGGDSLIFLPWVPHVHTVL